MVFIDVSKVSTDDLIRFDQMMCIAGVKLEDPSAFAPLATNIWSEVLKELDLRGAIKLISGSYDNPFSARINRD